MLVAGNEDDKILLSPGRGVKGGPGGGDGARDDAMLTEAHLRCVVIWRSQRHRT